MASSVVATPWVGHMMPLPYRSDPRATEATSPAAIQREGMTRVGMCQRIDGLRAVTLPASSTSRAGSSLGVGPNSPYERRGVDGASCARLEREPRPIPTGDAAPA